MTRSVNIRNSGNPSRRICPLSIFLDSPAKQPTAQAETAEPETEMIDDRRSSEDLRMGLDWMGNSGSDSSASPDESFYRATVIQITRRQPRKDGPAIARLGPPSNSAKPMHPTFPISISTIIIVHYRQSATFPLQQQQQKASTVDQKCKLSGPVVL